MLPGTVPLGDSVRKSEPAEALLQRRLDWASDTPKGVPCQANGHPRLREVIKLKVVETYIS
jgi:hypothetical protein